ncbi:uncharacterized protein METZ01_LOCUS453925, partial [marine metagenome]
MQVQLHMLESPYVKAYCSSTFR